jgi:hypothetical protein
MIGHCRPGNVVRLFDRFRFELAVLKLLSYRRRSARDVK